MGKDVQRSGTNRSLCSLPTPLSLSKRRLHNIKEEKTDLIELSLPVRPFPSSDDTHTHTTKDTKQVAQE